MSARAVQVAPFDARSTNLKYILQARTSKNGIFALSKKWVFWSKRVFLDFFLGSFLDKFRHFGVGDNQFGLYVKNVET